MSEVHKNQALLVAGVPCKDIVIGVIGDQADAEDALGEDVDDLGIDSKGLSEVGFYVWEGSITVHDERSHDHSTWTGAFRPATAADLAKFGLSPLAGTHTDEAAKDLKDACYRFKDEAEMLRGQVAALRAAIKPFAEYASDRYSTGCVVLPVQLHEAHEAARVLVKTEPTP